MAGLVHEGAAVEFPSATPGGAVVILLRTAPEDIDVDHVNASEAALLGRPLEQLQGRVAPVLLDHEQAAAGFVASLDHAQAVMPAGRHRLLGHHVATGSGDFDRLFRMQAARRGQDNDVGIGLGEHCVEARVGLDAGNVGDQCQGLWIDVAGGNQLGTVGMRLQRAQVVLGDTTATDDCEADFAVGDRGRKGAHGLDLWSGRVSGVAPGGQMQGLVIAGLQAVAVGGG